MYEVEAKVAIGKRDFNRLQKELKKTAKFKGSSKKKDIYYNDTKKSYTRLRNYTDKSVFSFKVKEMNHGFESNIEIEWGVKDKRKWGLLLGKLGIKPTIHKTKLTEAYHWKECNIELNYISKLGYYLEIEMIVKTKSQIVKAKKELIDMFKKLGYGQKDFEKKYYLDLLQEL